VGDDTAAPERRRALDAALAAKSPPLQLSAYTTLARAQLAQRKVAGARRQLTLAKDSAEKTQYHSMRLEFKIAPAQVQAASKPADFEAAIGLLTETMSEAEKAGLVSFLHECRLATAEIEMKSGKLTAGRARLAALEKDAKKSGVALIARKAATASTYLNISAHKSMYSHNKDNSLCLSRLP
jgi:eukaryotic-like serine/threonine-protein kinase